jgi:tripartite-type tricarboxylate transporter receptor subunit TctC
MNRLKFVMQGAALLIAGAICNYAAAQAQNWPTKPVRVIIPHPAGGPADVPPRAMAQVLGPIWGQPLVIENRLGADGIIGAEACAKAAPDGYTLCYMSNGITVVNPILVSKMPVDMERDFIPIVHTGTLHSVVMAHPSLPVGSMQQLIAAAKAKPDAIPYGTYGQINLAYFVYQWLKVKNGASFLQVPYKGATQALQALLAGEVQVAGYALGQAQTHVKSGKVKPLAVNSEKRLPSLPDVPTLRELGIEVDYRSFFGFYAPTATPDPVIRRVNAEVAKLVKDPQFAGKYIVPQGFETDSPAAGSPEDFARMLRAEREEFRKLVKEIGLKPQ